MYGILNRNLFEDLDVGPAQNVLPASLDTEFRTPISDDLTERSLVLPLQRVRSNAEKDRPIAT